MAEGERQQRVCVCVCVVGILPANNTRAQTPIRRGREGGGACGDDVVNDEMIIRETWLGLIGRRAGALMLMIISFSAEARAVIIVALLLRHLDIYFILFYFICPECFCFFLVLRRAWFCRSPRVNHLITSSSSSAR